MIRYRYGSSIWEIGRQWDIDRDVEMRYGFDVGCGTSIWLSTTGLRPLCRKRMAFWSAGPSVETTFTRPNPVGDGTKWRVDTSVLSLRHTNQAIRTAVWFVFYDTRA